MFVDFFYQFLLKDFYFFYSFHHDSQKAVKATSYGLTEKTCLLPHIVCLFIPFLLLLLFKRTFLYLFYAHEYLPCMYVCIPCTCLMPAEFRKSVGYPGSGVADDCGPPCGCWERNPGPLEELSHFSCPLL